MMSLTYFFMVINKEDTQNHRRINRNIAFHWVYWIWVWAFSMLCFSPYLIIFCAFLLLFNFEHMFNEFERHMWKTLKCYVNRKIGPCFFENDFLFLHLYLTSFEVTYGLDDYYLFHLIWPINNLYHFKWEWIVVNLLVQSVNWK